MESTISSSSSVDILDGPKRSRICSVCQGPTESFHLNYGVSSCFSCRAFFRRSVQGEKYQRFQCKDGGHCDITKAGTQKCKKCRFDQCLKAGMKPDCVMNSEQKRKRFRKCLEKQLLNQDGGTTQEPSQEEPPEDQLGEIIRYNKSQRSSKQRSSTKRKSETIVKDEPESGSNLDPVLPLDFELPSPSGVIELDATVALKHNANSSCEKFKSKLMRLYEEEVDNDPQAQIPPTIIPKFDQNECISFWNEAMAEQGILETWTEELRRFHSQNSADRRNMRRHAYQIFLRDICGTFHRFAQKLSVFQQLCDEDQKTLLWRNPVNFVALFLGRYLGAPTNIEQLDYLFLPSAGMGLAKPTGFAEFCSRLDVKYSAESIFQGNTWVQRICKYKIPQKSMPVVAYAILFYTDPTFSYAISNRQAIETTFEMACVNLQDVFVQSSSTVAFFGDLYELSVHLFQGLRWVSEDIHLNVSHTYPEEEDNWLLNQITKFSDSLYKTPLGKDHIDDIVEYCACDIPFQRNLFLFMAHNYTERLRPILEVLNSNDCFPDTMLNEVWTRAKTASLCVILSKLESFENILELFSLIATVEDREHLRFRMSPLGKPMRPLRLHEVNKCSKILSSHVEVLLLSFLEKMFHLVKDDKLFFVVLVFILLKPMGPPKARPLATLAAAPLEEASRSSLLLFHMVVACQTKVLAAVGRGNGMAPAVPALVFLVDLLSVDRREMEMKTPNVQSQRTKICRVCVCITETYQLNYGVGPCFSSRAFFRRSVLNGKFKRSKCKTNEDCAISGKNRKQCKRCRYRKCVKVGMDPDCVMNEDMKQQRFKKCKTSGWQDEDFIQEEPTGDKSSRSS
eukprot:maker-scaffold131_size323982-snap-gene-1.6 protein:Tk05545 transcript:maker-scaffold131_size323982-snap-gene-1.6-mRNA-1 annotation:"oxysterols receptor lxr-alpha isoform 2"